MSLTVVRGELARILGEVSGAVGRINKERIRWCRVIADLAAGKTKAA
jgi:hypothetical protein